MSTCAANYAQATCPLLCDSNDASYNQENCANFDYFHDSPFGCDTAAQNANNENEYCPQCNNSANVQPAYVDADCQAAPKKGTCLDANSWTATSCPKTCDQTEADYAEATCTTSLERAAGAELPAADDTTTTTGSGLRCDMDGFVSMVEELVKVLLVLVSLVVNTMLNVIPGDLGKAVFYLWNGVQGLGNWIGYGVAAAYFFGLEFGYAGVMCEGLGYSKIILNYMNVAVELVESLGGMGDIGGGGTAAPAAAQA